MEKYMGAILIVLVCALVLVIVFARRKMDMVLSFILRAVMGMILIYFVNEFLKFQEIGVVVGMNPVTLLTTGTLGFPGVILLYGINFYKLL